MKLYSESNFYNCNDKNLRRKDNSLNINNFDINNNKLLIGKAKEQIKK